MLLLLSSLFSSLGASVHVSGGPLDNQTWQTEWKTAPLAKKQLYEYENQTLEAFVAASHLYVMFDCPVARQNVTLLATAHDCETSLLHLRGESENLSS